MFILKFPDGKYFLDKKIHGTMLNKSHYDYFVATGFDPSFIKTQEAQIESFKTDDINLAKVFKTKQSARSNNAYSWSCELLEVDVTVEIKVK